MASSVVIGLDIGTTQVRAAELRFGSGGPSGKSQPTLTQFGEVALPPGAVRDGEVEDHGTVSGAIKKLWSDHKFASKDVVLGVGNQRVIVRELDLPRMPMGQLRESLAFQVQELLPMPADEALLDFYPTAERTTEAGPMLHGMLVAATKDTVNANVLAVEGAGLKPQMVDLSAFALVRSLTRGELAARTVALVEIGARVTHIVIAAAGSPRFVRMLPTGGQNVTDAIAGAVGCSATDAERLKREIGIGYAVPAEFKAAGEAIDLVTRPLVEAVRNTFVYYQSNNPGAGIETVVLSGGGAHLPGIGQYLATASRLPVAIADPVAAVRVGKGLEGANLAARSSLLAMPLGLAYGEAS